MTVANRRPFALRELVVCDSVSVLEGETQTRTRTMRWIKVVDRKCSKEGLFEWVVKLLRLRRARSSRLGLNGTSSASRSQSRLGGLRDRRVRYYVPWRNGFVGRI